MYEISNVFNWFFCIVFFPISVIQLYSLNDKIRNEYLRIAANAFPVFIALGFVLFMRFEK